MSGTVVQSRADLEAEGDLLGAEFRLGRRTGAWLTRRMAPRAVLGLLILIVLVGVGFVLPVSLNGFGTAISAVAEVDLAALAVTLMALPPRFRTSRLYLYTGGIVMQAARPSGQTGQSGQAGQTEPAVLRWADLESVTLTVGSGYEGDFLASCLPHDRAGSALTVGHAFAGITEIATVAERLLAPLIVPGLLRRYDAGETVTVGRVTVGPDGITYASEMSPTPEWRLPWAEARSLDIRLHGHRITAERTTGRARRARMDGTPNGFAARYLIEHAARRAGITVTADDAAWDGETTGAEREAQEEEKETARDTEPTPPPTPALPAQRRRLAALALAGLAVLAIEGTVIGYLYAARPYPPVVTAVGGPVMPVSDGTDSVVFTQGGRDLVFTDGDSDLIETPVSGARAVNFTSGGYPYASNAVVSPDGKVVAAINGGTEVDLWNAATRASEGSLQPDAGSEGASLVALAYSPDGQWLAAADEYGSVYVWDVATGRQRVLAGTGLVPGEVQAMAFGPNGTTIALGDSSGDITLWDVATGAQQGTLTDPGQVPALGPSSGPTGVLSLSFAGHGSLLAAADANGNAYLWDTGGQSLVTTLSGPDPVTAVALNPAGTLVAGGTAGGETDLWDIATQQRVAVLRGYGSAVTAVAFSPDGAEVAAGDKSVIAVWNITEQSQG